MSTGFSRIPHPTWLFFQLKDCLRIVLLTLCLFFPQLLFSQRHQIKIENVTFPDGNQLAYAIESIQDSSGLIWFHASQEFYAYDGQKLFKLAPEAVGFPISMSPHFYMNRTSPYFLIVQDSLLVYDPVARRVVQAFQPKHILKSRKRARISYPTIGADGTIWALVISGVNFQYAEVVRSVEGSDFQTVSSIDINWYYEATLVRGGQFFVKHRDRVEAFDSTGLVKVYLFPEGVDPVMPSMVMDAENTIWVLHSPDKTKDQYAVYYLKEGQEAFLRLPLEKRFPQEEKFGKLFADGYFIWHWGAPFHLSRIHLSAGQPNMADAVVENFTDKVIEQRLHFPFYNSSPLMLFRDRSGVIWMTTRAGIIKMMIEEDLFRNYTLQRTVLTGIEENTQIKGITEDPEGNIYLSHIKGISVLNPATGDLTALPLNLPPQTQKSHALTFAQGLLFWNEYAIDPKTGTSKKLIALPTYDYLAHGLDPEGERLWIGVNAWPFQLHVFDIKKGETTKINLPKEALPLMNNEIRKIHHSPSTNTLFLAVWLGGVLELDQEGNILQQYDDNKRKEEKWHGNVMYELYEDTEGQLWVAHGLDAGLSKIDLKTREITKYPYQENSFIGTLKRVFQILPEGKDYLWLVTEKGTLRLNKNSGKLTRYPMFPTLSKMAFHRLPGLAACDGTFYIGTPDGILNAFDPAWLHESAGFDQTFRVAITRYARFSGKWDSLFIQQTNLANLQEIRLTHQDRYFNLEFFIPDFRNTGQNLYSYWLEGYDKDWSPASRINQLQYENLPPGQYTLHIRGGLTPEYYKSSERILKVSVARAWYRTWWAFLLYIAGVLGIFFYFYRQRLKRELEKAEGRRLRELNTLKSRLYTNITHEFRTPLTVIMGMIDNIQGHEQERKLIRRNSHNLLRLINQLLDLSKLDAGTLNLDLVQGNIINYLQYLTESFYSMAHEKEVRLTFYSEISELIMDFDEGKIQHIVYNLLSNALKFTGAGGRVVLHVNEVARKAERYLQLKVQDTGVGIPEEQLPHIFDRFFQADSSSTRKSEGTGIGLALTKELIELMEGSIRVESALERGTTFTLLLPIRADAQTSPMQGLSSSSTMPAPEQTPGFPEVNPTGEKPLLLLIEDNADVVTYIASLLEQEYDLQFAPNGQTGIDKAFEIVPDIIISDVMMPEKDGYEVCETLKEDERTSHIPIILLTAKAAEADRIAGLRKGADAYLMKPFNKEELLVRLAKLLELRQALQQRYASVAEDVVPGRSLPAAPSLEDIFIHKLHQTVIENLDNPNLGAKQLCQAVHLSTSQLYRKLSALTGEPPNAFIRKIRLHRAMDMLKTTDLNISEIAFSVGFNDPNYFSRAFSKQFSEPPSNYRN